jgi:hypothetical protein
MEQSLPNKLAGQVDGMRVALRLCFGAVPLLAGLDKFFNLLTDWPHYLSPLAAALLPVAPATAMHVIGVVEIAVGLMVLSPWTIAGSLIASVWLGLIALNLIAAGFFDIAVRDLVLAVAAYTLACLSAAHDAVAQRGPSAVRAEHVTAARTAA